MESPQTLLIARLKAGLTQKMLADTCNLTQTTISHLETGKSTPQERTRQKLESTLGCSIDWRHTFEEAVLRTSKS